MAASILGPLLVAFGVAMVATPLLRKVAVRAGFVDKPAARKSHATPVPYLGGVAIMLGSLAAMIGGPTPAAEAVVVGLGAVALGVTGLLDDRYMLRARPRVVVQLAAAVAVVAAGVRVAIIEVPVLDAAVTVLWILALVNAMNLVDNMDGLSGGLTVAMGSGVMALAWYAGQSVVGAVAASLVGATAGFLLWNLSPWRIFMGDAGALFVGFVLAVVVVEAAPLGGKWSGIVVVALLVAVPMLDVATVVAGRLVHGRRIDQAGKDHLSHRLVARGLSPRKGVAVLVVVQLVLSWTAVAVGRGTIPASLGLGIGVAAGLSLLLALWAVPVYGTPVRTDRRRWLRRLAILAAAGVAGLAAAAVLSPGDAAAPSVLAAGRSGLAGDIVLAVGIAVVLALTASLGLAGATKALDLGERES